MLTRRLLLAAPLVAIAGQARAATKADKLAAAAKAQIGVTTGYDSAYVKLAYPGGDLPRATGVCADVVIRAARDGLGLDLQRLVHEDMVRAFGAYPTKWGLKQPDANIDHRRVPNLETYWRRQGAELWRTNGHVFGNAFPREMRIGDILTWRMVSGGPHVGIVTATGPIRVTQNIGHGVHEDALWTFFVHSAHGHYRWPTV